MGYKITQSSTILSLLEVLRGKSESKVPYFIATK